MKSSLSYEFNLTLAPDKENHEFLSNAFAVRTAMKQFISKVYATEHIGKETVSPHNFAAAGDLLAGRLENFKSVMDNKDAKWVMELFHKALEENGISSELFNIED